MMGERVGLHHPHDRHTSGLWDRRGSARRKRSLANVARRVPSFCVDPLKKPPLVRHPSDRERRRRAAPTLYHSEMFMRSVGHPEPALLYDVENDLFRFRDGRFAFSRGGPTGRC
jgi:hypothetical protein